MFNVFCVDNVCLDIGAQLNVTVPLSHGPLDSIEC